MPAIKTASKVVPMIYAYTTPGITYHEGFIKIGYTEQDVDKRIYQQTHTAGVKAHKEWQGVAIYDYTGEFFRDTDFHAYLRKLGIKQKPNERDEWFQVSPSDSHTYFINFRANRGKIDDVHEIMPYVLRDEQADAVRMTLEYRNTHEGGEFLWNAKPRFGKTLTVYDLALKLKAKSVLIVTNRPSIANSWYSDYEKFIGRKSGYFFVSNVDELKKQKLVMSYRDYEKDSKARTKRLNAVQPGLIEFVSLQDLKGAIIVSLISCERSRTLIGIYLL